MKISSQKKSVQSALAPRAIEQISALSLQREMQQSHNIEDINALNMLEDDFHMH